MGSVTKYMHIVAVNIKAFNPHVCGECNESTLYLVRLQKLSTPTYVGSVTTQITHSICPQCFLSTPTYVGSVTHIDRAEFTSERLSTPTYVGSVTTHSHVHLCLFHTFNPHVCGECNTAGYDDDYSSSDLSTPTYVGSVTDVQLLPTDV